jgi:hypothetical protein
MDRGDAAKVEVTVNNYYWVRVANLLDAGPDDRAFSLDPQTGAITFGDGVNGTLPPVGSTIVVSYCYGAGSAGSISKTIDSDGDVARFWVIMRDGLQALGWGDRTE